MMKDNFENMFTEENFPLELSAISEKTKMVEGVSFCTLWPNAKQALEMLETMVKNPVVKFSIRSIIAAGDFVYGRIC